jgi:hypothetical protein
MKKSQISIFILVAIVLIILLLVFLFFTSGTDLQLKLKQTRDPVPYYIENCMNFKLVDAISILVDQGGFIYSFTPNLTTTKKVFAYSVYEGYNSSPSLEFMQSEISRYIERNIQDCIDSSGYNLSSDTQPKAFTIINPESVSVQLEHNIEYVKPEKVQSFEIFETRHVMPLGRMIQMRDIVVKDLLNYPNLMLLDKLYDTDFEMIISPYSGDIKVIEMINASARLRNNPLKFSFAIRDRHSLPSELKFSQPIPDITATVGIPMIIKAECNHGCRYYDNTILFDIDPETGIIHYTPERIDIGTYNITITIDDDNYKVSRNFRLVVQG